MMVGDRNENAWKNDDFLSFGEATTAAEDDATSASDRSTGAGSQPKNPRAEAASSASAVTDLPPWMDCQSAWQNNPRNPRRPSPLVALHNEIVDFATLMEPKEYEIREREELVERVTKLCEATFPSCIVRVFGSQATGLFLPTSDIDIVLLLPDANANAADEGQNQNGENNAEKKGTSYGGNDKESQRERELREMREWDADPSVGASSKSPLVDLGEALRKHWEDELSYLEVIEATRIPIVKFRHTPTNLAVDICINQETGTKAAELVKRFCDAMPPLRPLTFVMKYFMAARGLNEPYTGGVGSFLLQMMIVSFLQHREREEYQASGRESILNLGSLLLEFFELYGLDFNYVTTGISVRSDGSYFPKGAKNRKEYFWQPARPYSLALENPFEPEMDVGKASFRMQLVQKSFEVAFRVLLSHVSEPSVPTKSILASILAPTEEMTLRAASAPNENGAANNNMAATSRGSSSANNSDMDMSSGGEDHESPKRKRRRKC